MGGDQERTLCPHGRDRHWVAWLGNELVGERGLFLNPAYELWKEKHYGPHNAAGEWREVADRVCTSIGELAALRGRPEFGDAVGVITLLG